MLKIQICKDLSEDCYADKNSDDSDSWWCLLRWVDSDFWFNKKNIGKCVQYIQYNWHPFFIFSILLIERE